jgi:hypothetical protein
VGAHFDSGDFRLSIRGETGKSEKDHAGNRTFPIPKNQLTEILVPGKQDRTHLICLLEYQVVRDACLHLGDVANRMAILSQTVDDLPLDALVSKKDHAAF